MPPSPPPSKMASAWARLSPVPAFPEYTGPYKVGTVDVEIPIADLEAPSPAPSEAEDIPTIQFRVFYPAVPESTEKSIGWLPNPQRQHVTAYTTFLGINPTLAGLLSFLPRHLHYTTIPVHKNAKLHDATSDTQRWPTMIFSHGLGGCRNSYSYIAGSLASHGVIVICPEHRDGSAITTFVRTPEASNGRTVSGIRQQIPYIRISHDVTPEVHAARERQMRIRMWEMGLIHQAVLAIDRGTAFTNLNTSTPSLNQFRDRLNVHEPGSIIFGGHSFGAATVSQFIKSTYYAGAPQLASMNLLFSPSEDSDIRRQITEKTVTMLLDMWCLPLVNPDLAPLYNLPFPCYADVASAPGGKALLAVESESFYKWTEHLHTKARFLSPNPSAKTVTPEAYERPSGVKLSEPNFFYVVNSAHLNQSDFGILFPWVTKKVFSAEEPERALRLNLRAQLQFLRENGVPVSRTYTGDLVDGTVTNKLEVAKDANEKSDVDGITNDVAIFERKTDNSVEYWKWIDLMGMGDPELGDGTENLDEKVAEGEAQRGPELEAAVDLTVQPTATLTSAVPAA